MPFSVLSAVAEPGLSRLHKPYLIPGAWLSFTQTSFSPSDQLYLSLPHPMTAPYWVRSLCARLAVRPRGARYLAANIVVKYQQGLYTNAVILPGIFNAACADTGIAAQRAAPHRRPRLMDAGSNE